VNHTRVSRQGLTVALGILLLAAGCARRDAVSGSSAATTAPAAKQTESTRLIGKWQRPDGGYVLDIRGTSEDGLLDAGYFNPSPIHVSKATWQRSEGGLAVFVELRDTGYPGATYRLQYRAADDKLAGAYTQPAVGQTFDVEFMRQP